ncbi:MAG TPA: DUF4166 domain-containing protein [Rhizomicrobium sp.]|nr:DUF4166 domain-containing protein [Rhizomicrobium sp.]
MPRVAEDFSHDAAPLGDLRFRKLLSDEDWFSLPPKVRARFSKRLGAGDTAVYVGRIAEMRLSLAGRVLVELLRLIGGPLPLSTDTGTASVVAVTEDSRCGGQVWTRLYARRRGMPQVIHSTKLFAGPTGLEEHVGFGIFMRLIASAEAGAIVFRSAGYFLGRVRLPDWLTPGALTVTHAETGPESFVFTLEIVHPRLGRLLFQAVEFHA